MKHLSMIASCAALAFAAIGPAQADDFIADCEQFKADNGIDGDCACMAEAATDADVRAELMATTTLDDLEGISDAAQAVVDSCS
ncbi:MAG: hypothetical protein AAGH48_02565 [Pseudomonadota bacterium]